MSIKKGGGSPRLFLPSVVYKEFINQVKKERVGAVVCGFCDHLSESGALRVGVFHFLVSFLDKILNLWYNAFV